jgi:hypothetical protein
MVTHSWTVSSLKRRIACRRAERRRFGQAFGSYASLPSFLFTICSRQRLAATRLPHAWIPERGGWSIREAPRNRVGRRTPFPPRRTGPV